MVNIINHGARTKTLTQSTKATAVTTAVAIVAAAGRRYLYFRNDDPTDDIYLGIGVAAVLNTGIELKPGEIYVISNAVGNLDTRAINCIASANTPLLIMVQGVEE